VNLDEGASTEQPAGGLYEGFETYRSLSDADFQRVLQTALVVVDTNVLLNLYRFNEQTRSSLLEVLHALGSRLWIPHRVLEEFWRNRERAATSPKSDVNNSVRELDKQHDAVREVLRQWVNRAALSPDMSDALAEQFSVAFHAARNALESLVQDDEMAKARNTAHDPVLQSLELLLAGKVGAPMPPADYAEAVKEGQRRVAAGEPPGYADQNKAGRGDGEGAEGDYLVWEQCLREAAVRQIDIAFVTGDVKRDWWRYEASFPRGPRVELVEEMRTRVGTRLYMMRPETLLTHARVALSVAVEDSSVQEVERADRAALGSDSGAESGSGWTAQSLLLFLAHLLPIAPVQEATIRRAIELGGFVSREEVYRIGEYDPDRQLRGFSRPVNRLAQRFRDDGTVPSDASDVLQPVYDTMSRGLGWVDGFRVPEEIVRLMKVRG